MILRIGVSINGQMRGQRQYSLFVTFLLQVVTAGWVGDEVFRASDDFSLSTLRIGRYWECPNIFNIILMAFRRRERFSGVRDAKSSGLLGGKLKYSRNQRTRAAT
jgi:hypothetical protein